MPADAPPGPYLNTTGIILATADEESVAGRAATDTLIVAGVSAPVFDKAFIDDPVLPGGTVTLEFTVTNADGTDPAVDLAFTDDLGAVLPGLVAVGLPLADVCGIGSTLDGTTVLSLTGGSLAPATSCTFSATLQAPGDAVPGTYPNITSELTGTVGGVAFAGDPATDDLVVGGFLQLTKEFTDDPVLAGAPVTLEFTLVNDSPTDSVTGIQFTDDLDATLTGLAATGLPLNDICGAGSHANRHRPSQLCRWQPRGRRFLHFHRDAERARAGGPRGVPEYDQRRGCPARRRPRDGPAGIRHPDSGRRAVSEQVVFR